MTQFYDTDLGFSQMSARELNEIAVHRAGVVGSIGYGYATRGPMPEERHGYQPLWVATGGMSNCGRLVLTARSRVAREMLRQGRVTQYVRELDISAHDADRLERAAAGVQYGRELRVLAAVVATGADEVWASYPRAGGGVWRWVADRALHLAPRLEELSAPRLDAVATIALRLQGRRL